MLDNINLIKITKAVPRVASVAFVDPINWEMKANQHWAIIGPNGAGKTLFIDVLMGKYGLKSGEISGLNNIPINTLMKSVAFRDIYGLIDVKNSYYQQRWNTWDDQDAPVVSSLLDSDDAVWKEFLIVTFAINDLIDKTINLLSSGELRKTLIVKSLLSKPRVLVLDNPFIGLDDKSRELLKEVLKKLAEIENLQIVLVLSDPKDIPSVITHVLPIKDRKLLCEMDVDRFLDDKEFQSHLFNHDVTTRATDMGMDFSSDFTFDNALVFNNIHIKYGARSILQNLNWKIKKGEKWALLGENGSGKSTLLSLVAGDNPQAYANDITLFDRKRGTGESIWDIKKHIGYVSPEMHLYYLKNVRCLDVVGSGFFDTIGLYKKCSEEQEYLALKWMKLFNVDHIKETSFLNVSTGEQRLVLLARVFVKNPNLLILDEPLHGLDVANKARVKRIIEEFCTEEKSLIYVTHYEEEIPDVISLRLILRKQN